LLKSVPSSNQQWCGRKKPVQRQQAGVFKQKASSLQRRNRYESGRRKRRFLGPPCTQQRRQEAASPDLTWRAEPIPRRSKTLKTVVGLFDDFTQAQRAVQDLENSGFSHSDISLIANNASGQYDRYANTVSRDVADATASGAGTGAVAGAVVGGGLGLLAGLGLLVIPGFGPVVAAGWLLSTLTGAGIGAATGGLLGALVGAGVPHEEARIYDEGVRRGGTLIAVKASDDMAAKAADILNRFGAVDIDERAESYRQPYDISAPTATSPATDWSQPASNTMSNNTMSNTTPGFAPAQPFDTQHTPRNADSGDYESDFRSNYNRTYANSGMTYEQFAPAYRYGYGLYNDARYRGKDWNSVQYDVQRDWESRQPGTWNQFSMAIRYAWDKATGAERGGIKTGGQALDGSPDTRGITEKVADAVTGDRIDDKTGKPVG
jgi:hypothetical protein